MPDPNRYEPNPEQENRDKPNIFLGINQDD